jgi:hypothetical protein
LVVVMVLFFIISMVAAYTSRNLIFEQRTSINQYRSTQALEAAEAGLEWTLAMLNGGLVDNAGSGCSAATSPGGSAVSFRQLYLNIDSSTGNYTPRDASAHPTCFFDGSIWNCKCPTSGEGEPDASSVAGAAGIYPAFRVRFQQIDPAAPNPPSQPGLIRVVVSACTRLSDDCLSDTSVGAANEARATVTALASVSGTIAAAPVAALTARGSVDLGGSAFTATNTTAATDGITVRAGGMVIPAGMVLQGKPGTPGLSTILQEDPLFSSASPAWMTADRYFASVFNVWPATFRDQPAAVVLNCGVSGCTDTDVLDKIAMHPGHPIWVAGNLVVGSADIGSAAAPALLIVNGDLTFSAAHTVYGLVYLRQATWTTAGTGTIQGAVVAEGDVEGTGVLTLVHDAAVLTRLRYAAGSLVRVPGSWKDFQ